MTFDSLEPITVPVSLGGKLHILREASEDATCKWRNAGMRGVRFDAGKVVGIGDGVADADPFLLSLCLYVADEKGQLRLTAQGNPDGRYLVPLHTIRAWKPSVVKALVAKLREISDLVDKPSEEETEEALVEKLGRLREKRAANGEAVPN